jgi:hypothetical protein
LESAKECVTTHLPNELALKMDGAKAGFFLYFVVCLVTRHISRRAWRL